MPWSLDICSTQRSPIHRVLLHGVSNRDTHYRLVPAAQQLLSLSDNSNICAAQLADHQWNAKWADNPTRLRTLIPDTGTHTPPEWPCQEEPGSSFTVSAPVLDVSAPACTNGVWRPLRPVSVAQKNKAFDMSSSHGNPSTSPRAARPDRSGRWNNRMAAQHLPRNLARPIVVRSRTRSNERRTCRGYALSKLWLYRWETSGRNRKFLCRAEQFSVCCYFICIWNNR